MGGRFAFFLAPHPEAVMHCHSTLCISSHWRTATQLIVCSWHTGSLPSSITTWVALRAMPEFMANLRKACLEMRKWKRQPILPLPSSPREPTKEPPHIETPQNSYSYHQNKQSSASSAYA